MGRICSWRNRVTAALIELSLAADLKTACFSSLLQTFRALTVEAKLEKDYLSIIGGVNNIFKRSSQHPPLD